MSDSLRWSLVVPDSGVRRWVTVICGALTGDSTDFQGGTVHVGGREFAMCLRAGFWPKNTVQQQPAEVIGSPSQNNLA
jgi:hypothetical protein